MDVSEASKNSAYDDTLTLDRSVNKLRVSRRRSNVVRLSIGPDRSGAEATSSSLPLCKILSKNPVNACVF